MAIGTGLALGLGAAGILGGIAGSEDQVQNTQSSSRTVLPGMTPQQQQLQDQSLQSYLQQLNLAQQSEQNIGNYAGVQGAAQGKMMDVLGGQAFNITPEQQAQIEAIRNASIQAGQGEIQNFVNQQLQGVNQSASARGLRGQALGALQGRAIGEGARQIGNLVGQANQTAAQQALQVPYQQAALQAQYAGNNLTLTDQLRQQAINNRQQLQNPALLNFLQQDRLAQATTYGTGNQNTPASFGSTIGGIMGGVGSIAGAYGNVAKAFRE